MFQPDYRNIVAAASGRAARRLPLYEHLIDVGHMEACLNRKFAGLIDGGYEDKKEFFRCYCAFFLRQGYDTVSFEQCIGGAMPGSGALGRHVPGVIKTRADFDRYPWDAVADNYRRMYYDDFRALAEVMPAGMKAIGGVGNGVFECVQDVVGYMDLCYMREDDPELYAALFTKVGEVSLGIWRDFLRHFADVYCVLRFGDDLGFRSSTLISDGDIRAHVIPAYRAIIDMVHGAGKPFLLHSCGCIFGVMEDLVAAGIDAKHSNEDQIAPFPVWMDKYGGRIGCFGGIDTDAVCRLSPEDMRDYILDVLGKCAGRGGFAFGSGNSIPGYVPLEQYLHMVRVVRQWRGEMGNAN